MFDGNTALADVIAIPAETRPTGSSVVDQEFQISLPVPRLSQDVVVRFRVTGAADAPLVAVLGGISSSRHVVDGGNVAGEITGWWREFAGTGRALDTRNCRVLGFDFPCTGAPSATGVLTTADQADLLAAVLEALGEERFQAVVGSSYGAMVALAFGAAYPQRAGRIVAISGAHASHPLAQAWRSTQRKIVELGLKSGDGREALALARGLAMTTYRSIEEFGERFDGPPVIEDGELRLPVDAYLEARGEAFAGRVSPRQFLELSRSLDLHRVAPEDVRVPVTLIAIRQDLLVPVTQMRELRDRLAGLVDYHEFDSRYGHDAFLKDVDTLSPILRNAIEAPEEGQDK